MSSPLAPLASTRERVIERLSAHFAQDRLSIDELDRRLERAYAATSLAELDALTADLPGEARAAAQFGPGTLPAEYEPREDSGRLVAILSETRRGGLWAVPPQLYVEAVMSNLTLDLRSALLGAGVTEIHLRAVMASVQIVLPPGVRVVDRMRAFMASVTDDSYGSLSDDPSVPTIRLTGNAVMAEVKVKTKIRSREI
jgi:Domain of unknown function (DUF1707)